MLSLSARALQKQDGLWVTLWLSDCPLREKKEKRPAQAPNQSPAR